MNGRETWPSEGQESADACRAPATRSRPIQANTTDDASAASPSAVRMCIVVQIAGRSKT